MAFEGFSVPVTLGGNGYNANQNTSQVPTDGLLQALNLTFENGSVQKEGGSAKYTPNSIGAVTILGGFDYWPTASVQRSVIMTSGGKLLKDSGAGAYATTLKSGMATPNTPPVFFEGGKEAAANNKKLFIYTGTAQVQMLDGDGNTASDLTTPPADWSATYPICGCIHQNRHWGAGNSSDPHRVYGSDPADHTNFTNANAVTLSIEAGVGQGIVALASYKGNLIAFKYPKGIFFVNTANQPTVANWTVSTLSRSIGIAGPLAFVELDDDIMFMDASGYVHMLSAVLEFGDYGLKPISDQYYLYNFMKNSVNLSRIPRVQAIFYGAKREVHFNLTKIGNANNGLRLVMDFNKTGVIRPRYSDKDAIESLWLALDSNKVARPVGGDTAGIVWNLDQDNKDVAGAGYNSIFQTPYWDFGFFNPLIVGRDKNFKFVELTSDVAGNWSLELDYFIDGIFKGTVSASLGIQGVGLGTFQLDSSQLSGASLSSIRKRLTGHGRRISYQGSLTLADGDFAIANIVTGFTVGKEGTSA